MRPDGSDLRPITPLVQGRYDIPGSVSPAGIVAFTRGTYVDPDDTGREKNTNEIWLTGPDGDGTRKIAERSQDPAFSSDGRRIAFSSDRDENGSLSYGDRTFFASELYVMASDGSEPQRLTRTRSLNERQPSWLPSGKRLAYQRGQTYQNAEATLVMQANPDGTCARAVFPNPGPDRRPWYAAPEWRPGDARSGDHRFRC
jgi:Tol biopolymer transport system component